MTLPTEKKLAEQSESARHPNSFAREHIDRKKSNLLTPDAPILKKVQPSGTRNGITGWLQSQRQLWDRLLVEHGLAHTFSLPRYRLHQLLKQTIVSYAQGECLDIGSGLSPYGTLLAEKCRTVTSVDIEDRSGHVDVVADIQDLSPFSDESVDTVFCTQVLEHVPQPWKAFREISRVLKPGGRALISVPHLSMIHEAPHDYFRYTPFGLNALCENSGLVAEQVDATGGLLCFVSHGFSWGLMSTIGSLPLLRWPIWLVNYFFLIHLADMSDRLVGLSSRYPCDLVLMARKRIDKGK